MKRASDIPLFEEIRQYNNAINITLPRYEVIDIRRFSELVVHNITWSEFAE